MQDDEVAVFAIGMGIPGAILEEFWMDPFKEPQNHYKYFAGRCDYKREVLPRLSLSLA